MPQFQEVKKGYARVRVLSKDATRAYLLLMRQTGGKMQVMPNDIYVIEEKMLPVLEQNGIEYETIERR